MRNGENPLRSFRMEERPLLLIFGAGYLATFLTREACKRGWRVEGLTRNPEREEGLRQAGMDRVVLGDLDSTAWWEAFSEAPAAVVNTVSSAGGGLEGYEKSYVAGNRSLLQWAEQHVARDSFSPAPFIYTSSTGVYPDRGGDWVQESDVESDPEGRAAVLRRAETLVCETGTSLFGTVFVLRLAGLYGPGRLFLARQLREDGLVAGSGDYYLNLLRIEDAASAILACAGVGARARRQIYNVTDGSPALKSDIVGWLGERMGLSPPFFDPGRSLEFRSRGGKNRRVDSSAIRKDLGWKPQYPDFREGFEELVEEA